MESVIECKKVKEWNGKPIYAIGLSDGQSGESFSDIPLGTPVSELQITANPNPLYADRIKWNKPNQGNAFGGGRQKSGNESFALAYSKDYAVAKIGQGKDFSGDDVLKLAEMFYNWMESKKKA